MTPARSPRPGDHETFDELAVGWALHSLEPEDEALFARHLPDCARCTRTVAETFDVMAALAADLPPADPSDELRGRLRAEVERTDQEQRPALPPDQPAGPPEDPARPPRRIEPRPAMTRGVIRGGGRPAGRTWPRPGLSSQEWRRRLPVLVAGAAAAVILGLGAWNVVLNASREQAQATVAEQSHIVDSLLAPGQATIAPVSDHGGHAVATVVARQGQLQVVTWGLTENDATATTYVVWGMRQETPVALGTFDVAKSGMDMPTVTAAHTGPDDY